MSLRHHAEGKGLTMKHLVAALALALATSAALFAAPASASEGCYICTSASSGGCQQCPYGSKDSQEARKACEKRGCKIGGTKSCSTASNAKTCSMPNSSTMVTASR
jgi:ABC-type sugar transport system substrate-binding protein